MDCIFCRIISGDLPSSHLADTELAIAFLDINPINPGHALIVPRRHEVCLSGLTPTEIGALGVLAQRLAAAQREALSCEGINLFMADGDAAGQEVCHAHLHVIPRHSGDGFGLQLPPSYKTEERERQGRRVAFGLPADQLLR